MPTKPFPRNGRLIRGMPPVGGAADESSGTDYSQFGDLVADYNPVNATLSGGRVTLVTEPVNGFNAAPNVAGTGPNVVTSASYGNKLVFRYAPAGPAEGAERLVTTAGLGAILGTSAWTLVAACHSNTALNGYLVMHSSGANYGGAYANGGSSVIRMYGPTNDVATTAAFSPAAAISMGFEAGGGGRSKRNQLAVGPIVGLGAPNNSSVFYIGTWLSPADGFSWNGDIARLLFYKGLLSDATMALVNAALQSEYSL
jgi:hypothetical protein